VVVKDHNLYLCQVGSFCIDLLVVIVNPTGFGMATNDENLEKLGASRGSGRELRKSWRKLLNDLVVTLLDDAERFLSG